MNKHVPESPTATIAVANLADERCYEVLSNQYSEVGTFFRTVWDFYLKFYVAFMALNFTALGLVIQYMDRPHRWPMALCFAIQNIFSAGTAWGVGAYSQYAAQQQQAILDRLANYNHANGERLLEFQTPVPAQLAMWGSHANALSQFLFIGCWIATLYVGEAKPH